ncbi:MAG: methyltransferase FkbM family [Microvirga sp.]|nr:methyltransferase FkbM family [Microvirga sp.]
MIRSGLKLLLRSRSLRFVLDDRKQYAAGVFSSYVWNGHPIWYRPGSSDTELIYTILLKRGRKGEYAIEPAARAALGTVRTVLDIGANIGISTLYLAALFEDARIVAFEPVTENFSLLTRNTQHLTRVQRQPVALGEADETIEMLHSDVPSNLGGYSRVATGSDRQRTVRVAMRAARRQCEELGINAADVVKIDVEGSEWEVLNDLGSSFLSSCKFIIGELHGRHDFEVLNLLSEHFDVSVRKNLGDRCFMFQALNRHVEA